ncbi:MAG TPA: Fur family transcriptional regulator [Bacteroidales bacterium]|nr:Fur family transcriptional regulator [Bacteroidales bacterium]HOK74750.1 Fur family transcriptional regulator [Bacteroidales bacterium]HOM40990.1 Fur family transcriptional regulator [Bacteroidales bacterium]HPP92637.1 Fur family transcriptional regulator [Bacteroidales bacterium]HRR16838.1 Fur family transcriptional regulator [Bacteroidales bacterium]
MADITAPKILMDHGLKVTPQRTLILEALISLDEHPSYEIIMKFMRFRYPNISLATIYNTLKLFKEKGIIKQITAGDEEIRFDPVQEKHHHLYYKDTDKLEDFEDKELDRILKNYFNKKQIPGFKIEDISIMLTGHSEKTQTPEKSKQKTQKKITK